MADILPDADILALASLAAPRMVLVDINLVAARLQREGGTPIEDGADLHSEFGFKVEQLYVKEKKQLVSVVHFFSRGSTTQNEQSQKVYRVEASFAAAYVVQGEDEIPDAVVEAFAMVNGVYNCWPFWREYLQSSTVRMSLPPVILPLITGAKIKEMLLKRAAREAELAAKDTAGDDEPASE